MSDEHRGEATPSTARRRGVVLAAALCAVSTAAGLVLFVPADRAALLVQLLSSVTAVAVAVVPLCKGRGGGREE
ncbi:hypothetical protein ACFYUL_18640 [Streptomyces sp. NPDC004311]|uniref:hypothetical protein n=1 Tax=Streptomyces sp. NPDC004311 TaxID=3364698 RepID=UPI0036A2E589